MEVAARDKHSLTVGDDVLTTAQVDRLIQDLALARCSLEPEVVPDVQQAQGEVVWHHDPRVQFGHSDDGKILMGVRHGGFGWVVFTLSLAHASEMWALLGAQQLHSQRK
jgi:hypothetical protein